MQYEKIVDYKYKQNESIYLEDSVPWNCRFCGVVKDENHFKNKAHAVSEFVGNKSIFTKYECDACNNVFAGNEERELGKLTHLYRGHTGLKGKRGKIQIIPGLKFDYNENTKEFKIEGGEHTTSNSKNYNLVSPQGSGVSYATKTTTFNPRLVYKAWLKYALSVFPEDRIDQVEEWFQFLKNDDGRYLIIGQMLHNTINRNCGISIYYDTKESNLPRYVAKIDMYNYQMLLFLGDRDNYLPPLFFNLFYENEVDIPNEEHMILLNYSMPTHTIEQQSLVAGRIKT